MPNIKVVRNLCIGLLVMELFSTRGWAYDAAPVENGATITGKVTFDGAPPPAEIFDLVMSPDVDYCGKVSDGKGNRLLKTFHVVPGGGFNDVVIAVEGIERGKPFSPKQPQVTASTCRFFPIITVVRDKRDIRIINSDTIVHDIQAYVTQETTDIDQIFNAPLPPRRPIVQKVKLSKNRKVFRMQCGVHAYMQNWGYAIDNPYYDISKDDGTFTIPDLPPGTYKITAWHPLTMAIKEQTIAVGPKAQATVSFTYYPADVRVGHLTASALASGMSGRNPHAVSPHELQVP